MSVNLLNPMSALALVLVCLFVPQVEAAQKKMGFSFKSSKELKPFKAVGGKKEVSGKMSTKKGSGSLQANANVVYELPLFKKKDGIGTVTVSMYDDMRKDGSQRGPAIGLRNKAGYEFCIGLFFSDFTDGNKDYYLNHYRLTDKSQTPSRWVHYTKATRKEGWQKFTFEFSKKGLIVKVNGQDINTMKGAKQFDWEAIDFASFDRVVLYGDSTTGAAPVFFDDIMIELGPEGAFLQKKK